MHSSYARSSALAALESNARLLRSLLRGLPSNSPKWWARPDPERFTLHEIVAHLADYNTLMREQFERMIREDKPQFSDWYLDEAVRHYGSRSSKGQQILLQRSRRELRAWLEGLAEHEWKCTATRPSIEEFSIEDGLVLLIAHDAYHLEQAAEWLERIPSS